MTTLLETRPHIGIEIQTIFAAEAAERYVQQCHQFRNKLKRQLAAAYKETNRQKQRKLRDSYFKNKKVKVSTLHKAGMRLPSKDQWVAEAKIFDPFAPSDETLEWWYTPKRSVGTRVVCGLAPKQLATHYMLADVLWAQLVAPTFIYNLNE